MRTPRPRGTMSEHVFAALRGQTPLDPTIAPSSREDSAITLWSSYELHHRGFDDVDESWEWDPDLLRVRAGLERALEERVRTLVGDLPAAGDDPVQTLIDLIENHDDGPGVSTHVARHATRDDALEVLKHRSIYHLKETDTTAWVVPRLTTVPKAAVMEVLFDEYGNGDPNRLHHHLFERAMEAAGLDPTYGAYIDEAPVEILEMNSASAMFGLHRRWLGAVCGHFAAFEATSSNPSRLMARGLRLLGFPDVVAEYYDEHVEADAVHEQIALRMICGSLMAEDPRHVETVFFGAKACLVLEDAYAQSLLTAKVPAA